MDTTANGSHLYNEVLEEDIEREKQLEEGPSLTYLSAESLVHDEQFINATRTQGHQSTICQQTREEDARPVLPLNPDSPIGTLSIPDDSNQNRVRSAEGLRLHCQPEVQTGIEAVVQLLLENSRHLPGFTQIIEQATDNRKCDLGIKESIDDTMDDVDTSDKQDVLDESAIQGSEQEMLPEKLLGSPSTEENSTNKSCNTSANIEAHRLLDTHCETSENLGASNVKKGKQQDLIKRHKCPECDKLFPRASSLKRHIVLHLDDRPYQCTECEANYKSYSQLKRHLRIHTGEKPAKCEHCEKTFRTYNELYVHRRSHTGEKPFECKFCGKCFSTRGYRNTHERIHTGEKRFQCDICGMKFTESSARRVHLFTHTGETPYKCEVCGRGFTQAGNLSKHVKTLHSKVKPFKCQECDKEFAVKQELSRHFSRVHSSDKPHQCKHCGKKYAINSDLTQHMHTHRNRCGNCGTKFKTEEELQRHIAKKCLTSATSIPVDSMEGQIIDKDRQESIECVHSKNVGYMRERPRSAVEGLLVKCPPMKLLSRSEINQEFSTEESLNKQDEKL